MSIKLLAKSASSCFHDFPVPNILPVFLFSECPTNYTCMPNTGPNPISEYISYDNFGWSLLTSLQLVTMDYWESIYNSVSRVFVNFVTSDTYLNMRLCHPNKVLRLPCSLCIVHFVGKFFQLM